MLLLYPVRYADGSVDGIQAHVNRFEVAVEDVGEAPRQVGEDAPALVERPVDAGQHAELPRAHVVGEVVRAAAALVGAYLHLGSRGVANADVAAVGVAGELVRAHVREVGAEVDADVVAERVGCHEGQGEHPLLHVHLDAAGEVALEALSSAHDGHVVVLNGGVHLHSLVLEVESGGESPVAVEVAVDAEAEVEVGRQRKLVHASYRGGHAHGGGASYAVAEAQVVGKAVEQASGRRLYGRRGGQ